MKTLAYALSVIALLSSWSSADSEHSEQLFQKHCANCHGKNLEGGMAGSLLDDKWVVGNTSQDWVKVIKQGLPERGMPAWAGTLSTEEIAGLAVLIQAHRRETAGTGSIQYLTDKPIGASGHSFKLQLLVKSESVLWGLDYLSDGSMLVTEREGNLWHFKNKRFYPVEGIPEVLASGQGGLLDVAVLRTQGKSDWIYLAFSHSFNGDEAMTKIVRGKITQGIWSQEQTIFEVGKKFYHRNMRHFGARIVFDTKYVYFGVGDRGIRDKAQDLGVPNGKVFRLYHDGQIPADNPFIKTKDALPETFSYGHRNPQGLALHPKSGKLWLSEHGPKGGDEINIVDAGANYGWPKITYGVNYSGTPITKYSELPGMEQPKHYWVPSIAVSGIAFYQGKAFPKWNEKLLVAGMASQQLHLLTIEGSEVKKDEIIFSDYGRVRDVNVSPEGKIHLLMTRDGEGHLIEVAPVNE